ncbi:MAG: phage scaffolding protein [Bilifractor sp.]
MLEALKGFFKDGKALTYDQLEQAVTAEGKIKMANLAEGGYVSKQKYDDLAGQVTDLKGQLTQRDTDMEGLKTQLEAAQTDAGKLKDVQTQLTALQGRYDKATKDFDAKFAAQSYEFAVKDAVGKLKFSSDSARRAFTEDAMAKKLQMDEGKLLGFDDFVNNYREKDPGAFAVEKEPADPNNPTPPQIVLPPDKQNQGKANPFAFHFNGVRPVPKEE